MSTIIFGVVMFTLIILALVLVIQIGRAHV